MKKYFLALLFSALCLPQFSFAFGPDGHQSIGAVADALLAGTKAGEKVKTLLGGATLEKMSIWADCAKGVSPDKDFAYTSAGRYPECAPFETPEGMAAMSDFVRRNNSNCHPGADEENCHKQYHYTDVSLQHDHYKTGYAGTSDHDIVHAMQAMVQILEGKPAPAPFQIKDEKEALILLTHYVGDVHQPLHVGSIYLDASGKVINPDEGKFDKTTNTVGGNVLMCPCGNLHSMWDDVPQNFKRGRANDSLIKKARTVARDTSPFEQWPVDWADDSIKAARVLYQGTAFSKASMGAKGPSWSIALPLEYEKLMYTMKEDALANGGAHLAQLLQAIWPD
ncbi:S1/P1 nuclease [Undibacterium sp. TJN25]|uniref:S1/P1 nuclease n=1 Tax=Undibacterium sp. TJN25 TaxID=3413056 RepID=UPI003BF1409B